jgi:hypothetical protein
VLWEVATEGVRRGAPVLTGRAVERDSPHPFRPVAEALFSNLRKSGPPQVREQVARIGGFHKHNAVLLSGRERAGDDNPGDIGQPALRGCHAVLVNV